MHSCMPALIDVHKPIARSFLFFTMFQQSRLLCTALCAVFAAARRGDRGADEDEKMPEVGMYTYLSWLFTLLLFALVGHVLKGAFADFNAGNAGDPLEEKPQSNEDENDEKDKDA